MKLYVGAAAAACLMMVAQPAAAQAFGYEQASARVTYSDLDLNSTAGAAVMYGRIDEAAERVCGNPARERIARMRAAVRDCINTARANAISAAGSNRLTAYAASPGYYQRRIEINRDAAEARVHYADLNLDTPRGQAALERRLNRATDRLCRNAGDWRSRSACTDASREQAQTQVAAIMSERQLARAGDTPVVMAAASAPAGAAVPPPSAPAAAPVAVAASTADYGVCNARSVIAAFGASSAALGANARREIGYAVDSASVCRLDRAVIAADQSSPIAQRRAQALRAALVSRGVPASQITIENVQAADGSAVSMQFAGIATGGQTTVAEAREAGV